MEIFISIVLSLFLPISILILKYVLKKKTPKEKNTDSIYECGNESKADDQIIFNNRYFNLALIFLLFEIEILLLLPTIILYLKPHSAEILIFASLEIILICILLLFGCLYIWKNKIFDWLPQSKQKNNEIPAVYQKINER